MNKTRRPKQVMNWTPGGKRGRGKPRKNWLETICKEESVASFGMTLSQMRRFGREQTN